MEMKDGVATFHAETRAAWRNWLEQHHRTEKSLWLIIYRKESATPSVYYSQAVDEALCFGWVDSKINKRDAESYYQFFSQRNPKCNWSKLNKTKVAYLLEQGLMTAAGQEMIDLAKRTGTWNALDAVEETTVPDDMQQLFDQNPIAFQYWEAFPRSVKRAILEWILNAKRPETRQKRITETVEQAAKNIRANQYRQ
jgi:uncharacterized protein YdeI (YjbR/CyaY-like superfamily)